MHSRSITASVATLLACACMAGCNQRGSADAPTTAGAPASTPAVEAPPPTIAAQQELALTAGGARMAEDGLYVTLPRADFAAGKGDYTPSDTERVDRVATLLKERSELRVVISGRPDETGNEKAKQQLAQRRAEAVRDVLVSRGHVDASRIEIKGRDEAPDKNFGGPQSEEISGAELRVVNGEGRYVSRAALGVGGARSTVPERN